MTLPMDDTEELHLLSERIRQYDKQGEDTLFVPSWREVALHSLMLQPDWRPALPSQEGLSVAERHELVELLDRELPRQPEADHVALFRLFMQHRQETCFHEGETWARRDLLAETATISLFSDDTLEEGKRPA